MRQLLAPVVIAALAFPVLLGAQEQERKLLDRIQRPDMELTNPMQSKSFAGGGGMKIREAAVAKTSFDGTKTAPMKEFAGTRSFLGIKNPWFGNRVFETKTAALSGLGGPEKLNSKFPVRDASVGGFSDSGKSADINSADVELRPFLVRGDSQGAIEQISDRIHKEMTIDDIRELLNKPR